LPLLQRQRWLHLLLRLVRGGRLREHLLLHKDVDPSE